jgi:transposase
MAAPLSMDLRRRMVGAVEGGESRNAVAKRFAVAISTVVRLMQRYHATGSAAPGRMGGKVYALAAHEGLVRAEIAAHPDLTLEELRAALARHGIRIGRSSVDRFLKACKLTFKKSRSMRRSRAGRTLQPRVRRGASASRR